MTQSKTLTEYRVTQVLIIPALSPRHAARIAKGVQRMTEEDQPFLFTVEDMTPTPSHYTVDLSKSTGEPGYCERVPTTTKGVRV